MHIHMYIVHFCICICVHLEICICTHMYRGPSQCTTTPRIEAMLEANIFSEQAGRSHVRDFNFSLGMEDPSTSVYNRRPKTTISILHIEALITLQYMKERRIGPYYKDTHKKAPPPIYRNSCVGY